MIISLSCGNPAGNVDPSGLAGTLAGGLSSPTAEGWKAFGSSLWGNTFGAIIEEGARLGAPIGTGFGAFLYTDIGRAIDLSTTRQRNALAEAAEILPAYVSQRTMDQIAAERANAIGNGLKENVEYAEQVRDGAVAAGELALDVYMIVDGGVAAKRLVSGSTKAAARAVAPNGVTTNLTERLEANASRRLAEIQADAGPKSHFFSRHGAQTTIEQQYERALTGLTPDGFAGNAVDSGRFLSHRGQLNAVQAAEEIYARTGKNVFTFDAGYEIGEGFLKNATGLVRTSNVRAVFDANGKLKTLFPQLSPLP